MPTPVRPIGLLPIGFVRRLSEGENERDRSLEAEIVLDERLLPALEGLEDWSHIYVIFWMDQVDRKGPRSFQHTDGIGLLAARSPMHPNPIGLTLVELLGREGSVLRVRGIDALDATPVLDIKPYPDWEGELLVVTEYRVPEWLTAILAQTGE